VTGATVVAWTRVAEVVTAATVVRATEEVTAAAVVLTDVVVG